jgi:hypothetical protein
MDQQETENKDISAPEIDEASAFLREQLMQCQIAIRSCFDFKTLNELALHQQWEALKIAARLMQASASAANALKRVKGNESRHTVRVERQGGYPTPKKSKTNSGSGA